MWTEDPGWSQAGMQEGRQPESHIVRKESWVAGSAEGGWLGGWPLRSDSQHFLPVLAQLQV